MGESVTDEERERASFGINKNDFPFDVVRHYSLLNFLIKC